MTEGPWTSFNTVEAEPSSLVGVLLARTEHLEQSRAWTVALENRLAEVRALLTSRGGSFRLVDDAVRLIDSELVA